MFMCMDFCCYSRANGRVLEYVLWDSRWGFVTVYLPVYHLHWVTVTPMKNFFQMGNDTCFFHSASECCSYCCCCVCVYSVCCFLMASVKDHSLKAIIIINCKCSWGISVIILFNMFTVTKWNLESLQFCCCKETWSAWELHLFVRGRGCWGWWGGSVTVNITMPSVNIYIYVWHLRPVSLP